MSKLLETLERFRELMLREDEPREPEPLHYVSSEHFTRMEQYLAEHPNATAGEALIATLRSPKP
jgi:hypothetical protein